MKNECVVVLTARGKTRILREGGSQSWRLNAHNAGNCPYLVCVQNQHQNWGEPEAPHHTAFLVGKISGISKSLEPQCDDRWIIHISEYADINIPNCWDGNRNPVSYRTLEELGIDITKLKFTKLDGAHDQDHIQTPSLENLTIEEAKKLLAKNFNVDEEKITITINF